MASIGAFSTRAERLPTAPERGQRSCCVQYRESDFGFVSRLLAEESLEEDGEAAADAGWRAARHVVDGGGVLSQVGERPSSVRSAAVAGVNEAIL